MKKLLFISASCIAFFACRHDEEVTPPQVIALTPPDTAPPSQDSVPTHRIVGFYLLNEGNMGSNKSTLDYMDLTAGTYHRSIYGDANPSIPKELGDVGNDIAVYGNKLYAVINCSNKVEVMDKFTARRLGQIDIPNCRYIKFHNGYAYVTSYAGPVRLDPEYEQIGYVAKVDTASYQVVARCLVGFQPDELEIVGQKIYVANSGGYMFPNYESTISVIDIASFSEIKRIDVAINLHRIRADKYGILWMTSRGDYYDAPSRLYWVDTRSDAVGGMLPVAATEMHLDGDSLYIYSTEFSYYDYNWTITYGIIDVASKQLTTRNFITDGSDRQLGMPYGIWVHPHSKDIYITDAAGFVYPGTLICYDRYGKKKWQVQTGDIPAHFAPLYK